MRSIGDLESEVLRVVWARGGPMTVHDVAAALNRTHDLAYTTVITVAERLRAKGFLRREKVGRSFRYSATMTNEQYSARLMQDVLDSAADRGSALLHFAGELDEEEAAELRAALDRLPRSSRAPGQS